MFGRSEFMQTIIPVNEARRNLGELLNQAFYQGKPFILTRGKKPMAALIGAHEFRAFVLYLEKHNPGLADTLAIMSNPEVQKILEEGEEDVREGRLIPLEKI